MKELVSFASLALLSAHKLSISSINLDTTTKSVQGIISDIRNEFYARLKKKESTFVLIANRFRHPFGIQTPELH